MYFNFIAWLKWPVIILFSPQILIVIFSIKSIWKNRAIKTDPRISILQEDRFANEHLKRIGLMVAYEPASWFYFFPAFSKKLKPLGRIKSSGGSIFFCVSLMFLTVTLSLLSYRLISPYDQFIAAGISGVTLYFLVSVWANFRCTRYHSLAECNGKIIVNNGFYDFCFFEKKAVDSIELSTTVKNKVVFYLNEPVTRYRRLGSKQELVTYLEFKLTEKHSFIKNLKRIELIEKLLAKSN